MATGRPRIETWANGGSSTLDGGINDSVTSLDVVDASSFPAYPDFKIKIDSEILTVTAISSETFTVERGADGTVAASHSTAVAVKHVVSAGSLDRAFRDAYGADYDNGYPYNRILAEGVTKTASDFTWFNQGSGTCVDADDGGLLMTAGANEDLRQVRGKYISAPSTPWSCIAYVWLGNGAVRYDGAGDGTTGGVLVLESDSSKLYTFGLRSDSLWLHRMTNATTFSAEVDSFTDHDRDSIWMRLDDDGVDLTAYLSYNGYDWVECFGEGRADYMTSAGPDRIGFFLENGDADASAEVYFKSWIVE